MKPADNGASGETHHQDNRTYRGQFCVFLPSCHAQGYGRHCGDGQEQILQIGGSTGSFECFLCLGQPRSTCGFVPGVMSISMSPVEILHVRHEHRFVSNRVPGSVHAYLARSNRFDPPLCVLVRSGCVGFVQILPGTSFYSISFRWFERASACLRIVPIPLRLVCFRFCLRVAPRFASPSSFGCVRTSPSSCMVLLFGRRRWCDGKLWTQTMVLSGRGVRAVSSDVRVVVNVYVPPWILDHHPTWCRALLVPHPHVSNVDKACWCGSCVVPSTTWVWLSACTSTLQWTCSHAFVRYASSPYPPRLMPATTSHVVVLRCLVHWTTNGSGWRRLEPREKKNKQEKGMQNCWWEFLLY